MRYSFLLAIALISIQTSAKAALEFEQPKSVRLPVTKAYIPAGFDSNDRIELMIEGEFASNCYRIGFNSTRVDVETREVFISHAAYLYNGKCSPMALPYNQVIEIGMLSAGTYKIIDDLTRRQVGTLMVSQAKSEDPDDHFYATVRDAYVSMLEPDQQHIVLSLVLPGTCWMLAEKQLIQENDRVITVLPIMAFRANDSCGEFKFPYAATIKLPDLKSGRYLLHVRSLNGGSINKLIDVGLD